MNKTPLEAYPKLAKAIGVNELYFKREDLHPYGSHKGRSIPVMIDHYLKAGERRFAIAGKFHFPFLGHGEHAHLQQAQHRRFVVHEQNPGFDRRRFGV